MLNGTKDGNETSSALAGASAAAPVALLCPAATRSGRMPRRADRRLARSRATLRLSLGFTGRAHSNLDKVILTMTSGPGNIACTQRFLARIMRRIPSSPAVVMAVAILRCLLPWRAVLGVALAAPVAALGADLENGREINGVCAACHGELGQGGKKGEYPRLAGQSEKYLVRTLKSFKSRQRINIPMFPYTEERELPDKDIEDVAAYLASIKLPTKPEAFEPTDDALTRLRKVERVVQIPRAPGNVDKGRALYDKECAACHGKDGGGRGSFPALRGQYTNYLERQVNLLMRGDRPHDEEKAGEGILNEISAEDIRDVLAYVSTLDD